ncbi:unnamed protein product [Amoebophrya sp. A120]|nr:unnamed protein product [Amoebophrya sp. A120]|eukprot:GSA120T00025255001.1
MWFSSSALRESLWSSVVVDSRMAVCITWILLFLTMGDRTTSSCSAVQLRSSLVGIAQRGGASSVSGAAAVQNGERPVKIESEAISGESETSESEPPSFTVLSWNILSDTCLQRQLRPRMKVACPDWASRGQNILAQIQQQNPDVILLQEVDEQLWTDFFQPKLEARGYDGQFVVKHYDLAKFSKNGSRKADGCATLWRTSKFFADSGKAIDFHALYTEKYLPHSHTRTAIRDLALQSAEVTARRDAIMHETNPQGAAQARTDGVAPAAAAPRPATRDPSASRKNKRGRSDSTSAKKNSKAALEITQRLSALSLEQGGSSDSAAGKDTDGGVATRPAISGQAGDYRASERENPSSCSEGSSLEEGSFEIVSAVSHSGDDLSSSTSGGRADSSSARSELRASPVIKPPPGAVTTQPDERERATTRTTLRASAPEFVPRRSRTESSGGSESEAGSSGSAASQRNSFLGSSGAAGLSAHHTSGDPTPMDSYNVALVLVLRLKEDRKHPSDVDHSAEGRRKTTTSTDVSADERSLAVQLHQDHQKTVVIVNTHLIYGSEANHDLVRLWQACALREVLEKEYRGPAYEYRLPMILGGDFNAEPSSLLYQFMKSGYVPTDLLVRDAFRHSTRLMTGLQRWEEDLLKRIRRPQTQAESQQRFLPLRSAFDLLRQGAEPAFTQSQEQFQLDATLFSPSVFERKTLDYLFVTSDLLRAESADVVTAYDRAACRCTSGFDSSPPDEPPLSTGAAGELRNIASAAATSSWSQSDSPNSSSVGFQSRDLDVSAPVVSDHFPLVARFSFAGPLSSVTVQKFGQFPRACSLEVMSFGSRDLVLAAQEKQCQLFESDFVRKNSTASGDHPVLPAADAKDRERVFGTLLHSAAASGLPYIVRSLLNRAGATPDFPHPRTGRTALMEAVENGHHHVLGLLAHVGADLDLPNPQTGVTPRVFYEGTLTQSLQHVYSLLCSSTSSTPEIQRALLKLPFHIIEKVRTCPQLQGCYEAARRNRQQGSSGSTTPAPTQQQGLPAVDQACGAGGAFQNRSEDTRTSEQRPEGSLSSASLAHAQHATENVDQGRTYHASPPSSNAATATPELHVYEPTVAQLIDQLPFRAGSLQQDNPVRALGEAALQQQQDILRLRHAVQYFACQSQAHQANAEQLRQQNAVLVDANAQLLARLQKAEQLVQSSAHSMLELRNVAFEYQKRCAEAGQKSLSSRLADETIKPGIPSSAGQDLAAASGVLASCEQQSSRPSCGPASQCNSGSSSTILNGGVGEGEDPAIADGSNSPHQEGNTPEHSVTSEVSSRETENEWIVTDVTEGRAAANGDTSSLDRERGAAAAFLAQARQVRRESVAETREPEPAAERKIEKQYAQI